MKKLLIILIGISFLTSCDLYVFQLQTTHSNNVVYSSNKYRYEDSLLIINYDLWSAGGQLSFSIYNKSAKPLYIDWGRSNFIYNGQSYDYWQDNVKSTTNGVSVGQRISPRSSIAVGNSVTIVTKEKPQVQLPPQSFIPIYKFNINQPFYYAFVICDTCTYKFTEQNSPIIFRNYLSISKSQDLSNPIFVDNKFWIDHIKNTLIDNAKNRESDDSTNSFYHYHGQQQEQYSDGIFTKK